MTEIFDIYPSNFGQWYLPRGRITFFVLYQFETGITLALIWHITQTNHPRYFVHTTHIHCVSCSTTHSSPSFRLLTMFSIFFTHSARKIPASAAAPRTKRSRKRRVLRQQRTFNWTRVCFPRDFVLLWLLTSICQAEEFPVKERTNDGAGGGSRPKLSQGEGRPLPTSKLNLLAWFSKLFCFAF